jgi:hypothetical protein
VIALYFPHLSIRLDSIQTLHLVERALDNHTMDNHNNQMPQKFVASTAVQERRTDGDVITPPNSIHIAQFLLVSTQNTALQLADTAPVLCFVHHKCTFHTCTDCFVATARLSMLRIALDATKPNRWRGACRTLWWSVSRCPAAKIRPLVSSFGTVPSHETNQADAQPLPLVYESPLGSVVTKLRTVSLATALIGTAGVPSLLAIKGAVPEVGMLAMALMFVTGSMGSTAAIHFVFAPYVYRIETIPVRQCSYQSKDGEDQNDTLVPEDAESVNVVPKAKDVLLRAWTRSLFLRNREIVFDPEMDVVPYSGMRPLCNFVAKGFPLYVHPGTFWLDASKLYEGS